MIRTRMKSTLRVTGLLLLAIPLLLIAAFTVSIALYLIEPPIPAEWLMVSRNLGYNFFAGSVLVFLVAIFNQLRTVLKREP